MISHIRMLSLPVSDQDRARDFYLETDDPEGFQPRVGHRFTFRADPAPVFDGIIRYEVLRCP